ncbi:hypothetical protein F4824DRAFT_323680 [Ustulina deusta]|nr:hypothetical protein F4824DRAFT_323680 [Ustulina deusta]
MTNRRVPLLTHPGCHSWAASVYLLYLGRSVLSPHPTHLACGYRCRTSTRQFCPCLVIARRLQKAPKHGIGESTVASAGPVWPTKGMERIRNCPLQTLNSRAIGNLPLAMYTSEMGRGSERTATSSISQGAVWRLCRLQGPSVRGEVRSGG